MRARSCTVHTHTHICVDALVMMFKQVLLFFFYKLIAWIDFTILNVYFYSWFIELLWSFFYFFFHYYYYCCCYCEVITIRKKKKFKYKMNKYCTCRIRIYAFCFFSRFFFHHHIINCIRKYGLSIQTHTHTIQHTISREIER